MIVPGIQTCASPLATGVQSFLYDIRTAILPVVFIFNPTILLIGVDSVLYALMIFVVSLLAILAFASLTQNWLLVRNRWWESVLLALAIVALFRPGVYMDRFYPPFEEIAIGAFVSGEVAPEPGQVIRLHITRETAYGDRLKLFALETPDPARALSLAAASVADILAATTTELALIPAQNAIVAPSRLRPAERL